MAKIIFRQVTAAFYKVLPADLDIHLYTCVIYTLCTWAMVMHQLHCPRDDVCKHSVNTKFISSTNTWKSMTMHEPAISKTRDKASIIDVNVKAEDETYSVYGASSLSIRSIKWHVYGIICLKVSQTNAKPSFCKLSCVTALCVFVHKEFWDWFHWCTFALI